VILYLHGGPGEAQSPFLDQFKPWERDFTVVNWDQRGAGKTYEKNGDTTPDVTLEREAADVVALSEYVLKKFGKKKLVLVGQSFGTVIGLMAAQKRPDLFTAFVATGQVVNQDVIMQERERWAWSQANASGDAATLKALQEATKLPQDSFKRIAASRKYVFGPPDQAYLKLQMDFMGLPEHPKPAAVAWSKGYQFEAGKIGKAGIEFDARKSAMRLAVPYILIQGRDDHVTPTEGALAYGRDLRAPYKRVMTIAGGHFACFTNPGEFVGALRKYVVPLTRA
jgi:pimeloyl-ACP methyl ester carboxylesterase